MKAYIAHFYVEFVGKDGEFHVFETIVPATLLKESRLQIFEARISKRIARKKNLPIRSKRWEFVEKGRW